MLKVRIFPGKSKELDLIKEISVLEAINIAGIEIKESYSVILNDKKLNIKNIGNIKTKDGQIIITREILSCVPTPKLSKVKIFLKQKGYELIPRAGKGDHIKFKNQNGSTIIINRDNCDKKTICLGSANKLVKEFNLSLTELYKEIMKV